MNIASSNIALSLYRTGSLDKAISYSKKEFQRTLAMGDLQSATVFLQVWSLASSGDVPLALFDRMLDQSISNSQSILEAKCGKSVVLIRQGQFLEAAAVLREARQFLLNSMAIQEYCIPVLPWSATALRLALASQSSLNSKDRRSLQKEWSSSVKLALYTSLLRPNNYVHSLREAAYFYAAKGKLKKGMCYLEKAKFLAQIKILTHEQELNDLAIKEMPKYNNLFKTILN